MFRMTAARSMPIRRYCSPAFGNRDGGVNSPGNRSRIDRSPIATNEARGARGLVARRTQDNRPFQRAARRSRSIGPISSTKSFMSLNSR